MADRKQRVKLVQDSVDSFVVDFDKRLSVSFGPAARRKFVAEARQLSDPTLADLIALAERYLPVSADLLPSLGPLATAAVRNLTFDATLTGTDAQVLRALRRGILSGRKIKGQPGVNGVLPTLKKGQRAAASAVRRNLVAGVSERRLAARVAEATGSTVAQARTLVHTSAQGVVRTVQVSKARSVGIEVFRYVGPDDDLTRTFCEETLAGAGEGQEQGVYSMDEILAMDNGQGLPVWENAGGWNCRHTWEAVITAENLLDTATEEEEP